MLDEFPCVVYICIKLQKRMEGARGLAERDAQPSSPQTKSQLFPNIFYVANPEDKFINSRWQI